MNKEFADVAGEALEETRDKLQRFYPAFMADQDCRDAVNMALGMFSGAVLRRLAGQPDPDPESEK